MRIYNIWRFLNLSCYIDNAPILIYYFTTCPQGKSLKPIVSRRPQISACKISAEQSKTFRANNMNTCCTIEHFPHALSIFYIRNFGIPRSCLDQIDKVNSKYTRIRNKVLSFSHPQKNPY